MDMIKTLWLHRLAGSTKYKHQLLNCFGDIENIFNASCEVLAKVGCSKDQVEQIVESKKHISDLEKQHLKMKEEGIEIIDLESNQYPSYLKEIFEPPIALFVKGEVSLLNQPSIAIVGARKCSDYGFDIARKLAHDLGKLGITVVSGLAKGIDEAAHKGTIGVGHTVAVLGTGVNVCYPKQNQRLYQQILENGCIVSEYFPDTTPMPYQFPQRNRIISGMSIGTIVVEAEERSGSLITAQLALEQGREVFSVPGNIYSLFSKGTNKLIQEGAKLVTCAEDVLEEIRMQVGNLNNNKNENNYSSVSIGLDKLQIMVYDCLSWQPIQIESMTSKIDLTIEMIEMILLQLEIKGLIQRLPGRRCVRLK